MTYLGIALNLIGLALQLNPYYQSAWIALICIFFGGGFFFLGVFGRRPSSGGQFLQFLRASITPSTVNAIVMICVVVGLLFLARLGSAIYTIANREMDIQAARAGISTPSAKPTLTPSKTGGA